MTRYFYGYALEVELTNNWIFRVGAWPTINRRFTRLWFCMAWVELDQIVIIDPSKL
jgi:hypothetical protein